MNHRAELQKLALAVGGGLGVYIEVHDSIFSDAASFKSFVKNLLGRGVSMSELLQRSERLVILWSEIDAMVASFQRSDYASLSPAEKRYFNVLSGYVAALIRTVNALVDRQRLLNSKSEGTEVSWVEYKQKEEIYDDCVRQYKAIGHELNASSKIVFSQ